MREKTIMIKDAPFTYMDEVGDPYVFNAMTQEDMESILELAATLLKDCGIEFILSFGTLLGSVRAVFLRPSFIHFIQKAEKAISTCIFCVPLTDGCLRIGV